MTTIIVYAWPVAALAMVAGTFAWLLWAHGHAPIDPWDDDPRPAPEPLDMDWRWPR